MNLTKKDMRYSKWFLMCAVVILFSTIGYSQDVLVLDESRNRFLIDEKSTEPRLDVIVQSFTEYEKKGISKKAVMDTSIVPIVKRNGANNYTINASRMGEKLTFVLRGYEKLVNGIRVYLKYVGRTDIPYETNGTIYQLNGQRCQSVTTRIAFGAPELIISLKDSTDKEISKIRVCYSYPAPELSYTDFIPRRSNGLVGPWTNIFGTRLSGYYDASNQDTTQVGIPDRVVVSENDLFFGFKPAFYDGNINPSTVFTKVDDFMRLPTEEHLDPITSIFYHFLGEWDWLEDGQHTLNASYLEDGGGATMTQKFEVKHSRGARIMFLLSKFPLLLNYLQINYPWVFLLILGGIIYLIFRRRLKKARQLAAKNTLELQAIQAQLNPHFMFNSLGSIQGLIHKNEIEKASTYLTDFSKLLRNSLITNGKEAVPLSMELHTLDSYIKLEKLRFNFRYELNVDENIETTNVEIPSLLIQPLIENAIKHGIASSGEHGLLSVSFLKNERDLVIEIKDNGKGFDTSRPVDGQGIQLTRKRIDYLNKQGNKIKLDIISEIGQGCLARLVLKQVF